MVKSLKEFTKNIKDNIRQVNQLQNKTVKQTEYLEHLKKMKTFIEEKLNDYSKDEVEPFLLQASPKARRHVLMLRCMINYYKFIKKTPKKWRECYKSDGLVITDIGMALKMYKEFKKNMLSIYTTLINNLNQRIELLNNALEFWKFNGNMSHEAQAKIVQKQIKELDPVMRHLSKKYSELEKLEREFRDKIFATVTTLDNVKAKLKDIYSHIDRTKETPHKMKRKDIIKYKKYLEDIKEKHKEILPRYIKGDINILLGHLTFYFPKQHKDLSLEKSLKIAFAHYTNALVFVSCKASCELYKDIKLASYHEFGSNNLGPLPMGVMVRNENAQARARQLKGNVKLKSIDAQFHIKVLVKAFQSISRVYSSSLDAKKAYNEAKVLKKFRDVVERKFKDIIIGAKIDTVYLEEILLKDVRNSDEKTIFDEMLEKENVSVTQLLNSQPLRIAACSCDDPSCEMNDKFLVVGGSSLNKNKFNFF